MTDQAEAGSVAADAQQAGNLAAATETAENGSAAATEQTWFSGLSEGNRKLVEAKGWTEPDSIDKVLTSYSELERLQGETLRVPGEDAKPEDWDKFYSKLPENMRPVSDPEKLEFKRPEGLPEDLPYNDELASASKSWMTEAKLSPTQAQAMHDKFAGYMADMATAQAQEIAKSVESTHDSLVQDWGPQNSDKFKENLELANRAMKKLGLVDAYKSKGILLPDGSLTEPTIAKAFAEIGNAMFKEDTIGDDGNVGKGNPFKKGANGERNLTAISALVKSDPERAKRLAREAGENPEQWVPNNPL